MRKIIEPGAVYTTEEVAEILGRSVKFVRRVCRTGLLQCHMDKCGFLITGRSLFAFLEKTLTVD